MSEEVPGNSPIMQSCPDCAAMLDISAEEPLSSVSCPMCGAPMRARTQFNNFTLQKQIGVGGMGAVYRALDENLNRLVALKVVLKEFSSDPAYHAKFEHEAKMAALVNHQHVVKVFSFGSAHGLFYIAMELVDKGSLDELIVREGKLPEARVLEIGIQIAQGLQAAHQRGLIHRDVKPGNVLFADDHTAKIVDFGLALPMEHTAGANKRGEEIWGTPYYVAPEKLNHEPEDFRSDIYSLGASLFHAVAGRPTFEAETNSISALRQIKNQEVSLQAVAPEVSSATAYVINRTLRRKPSDRPQSYDELIEHLNYARTKLLEEEEKPRNPTLALLENPEPKKMLAGLMFALAGLVLVVCAGLFVFQDRILKKTAGLPTTLPKAHTGGGTSVEERYGEARKQLLQGDYTGAQAVFHSLGEKGDLPHPLDRWVMMHEGLCALLAGHGGDAQAVLEKLRDEGAFSPAPEERTLANFFVNVGRVATSGKPVPTAISSEYDPNNCEALGLLVFGLSDWEMSRFDEAVTLFQAFIAADPKPPYDWIAEYKPLVQKYIADFDSYKKVTALIKDADTLEKETAAFQHLRTLENSLQVPGRLTEKLAGLEPDLQAKIAADQAAEQQRTARMALQREQETKELEAARAKFVASIRGYRFDEGLAAIEKTHISDPNVASDKSALLKKAQWLVKFKETLIADFNATGYPQPVFKLNSAPIEGGVHKADKTKIEITTPYGSVLVQWYELPLSEVLAMADYFTKKANVPNIAADRMWLSGVFAIEAGMEKQGNALLESAAQNKPEYHDLLPLFSK